MSATGGRTRRLLARGAGVFLLSTLLLAAGTAQIAPGWQPGQGLEPLHPAPLNLSGETTRGAIDRESVAVAHRDGTVSQAWIVTPADAPDTVPGVVLVHGAGPADRDRLLPEAQALAAAGIATITYDKRTDGYSAARHRDFALLGDDAVETAEVLAAQERVDASKIGLLGVSEGGWVAPIAAQRHPGSVDFVMLASPTLTTPLREVLWMADSRLSWAPEWVRRIPSGVLSGAEPVHHLAPPRAHDPSWLLNPVLHLGLSLSAAVLAMAIEARPRRPHPAEGQHTGPERHPGTGGHLTKGAAS